MQKINIWRTILGSYLMLVDNFGLFFRTTWLLILISVPISTLSLIINPENHKDDRLNYLIALNITTCLNYNFAHRVLSSYSYFRRNVAPTHSPWGKVF